MPNFQYMLLCLWLYIYIYVSIGILKMYIIDIWLAILQKISITEIQKCIYPPHSIGIDVYRDALSIL